MHAGAVIGVGCTIGSASVVHAGSRLGERILVEDGVALGKVSHLFSTGANDVLVVRDGERERLIPYVAKQFVREVDLKAGRISVDWDPDF